MAEERFIENLGGVLGKWTAYAALGSFLLYLFGYLTLRFQLTTYGVATDLDIFDEKYLFAGCRFLVFLVSSVPNILIIILVLAAVGYVPYKLVPVSVKDRLKRWASAWCETPIHLLLLGVVLGVALIQFVVRKCFAFGNVLLVKKLPHKWLTSVLLGSEGNLALYFSGLVAGTLITAGDPSVCAAPWDSNNCGVTGFLLGYLFSWSLQSFCCCPSITAFSSRRSNFRDWRNSAGTIRL